MGGNNKKVNELAFGGNLFEVKTNTSWWIRRNQQNQFSKNIGVQPNSTDPAANVFLLLGKMDWAQFEDENDFLATPAYNKQQGNNIAPTPPKSPREIYVAKGR